MTRRVPAGIVTWFESPASINASAVATPLEKTLYANSITLTPGTLTTDVCDDHFLIHALSQEGIDELREGEMERRIRRIGL